MKLLTYCSILILIFGCSKSEDNPSNGNGNGTTPVADFNYAGANLPAPALVNFTNASTNADTYKWDFGDNSYSTDVNPSHTYVSGGVYTVKLTATGKGGVDITSKTINIGSSPTKVQILKVTLIQMPLLDPNGAGWDLLDGADVFFNVSNSSGVVSFENSTSRINNVTVNDFPIIWNLSNPLEIVNFNDLKVFAIYDYDSFDPNDLIGGVGFTMKNYTTGSNPYPSSVTESFGGVTIKLDLKWL